MSKISKAQVEAAALEFGREPEVLDLSEVSISTQVNAFNYYNYRFDNKHARQVLARKHPDIDWNSVKSTDFTSTYAWMYKLESKGSKLSPEMIQKRDAFIAFIKAKYTKASTKKEPTEPQKVQVTYKDKRHLAEFDEIEDSLWDSFNLVESIQKVKTLLADLSKSASEEIRARVQTLHSELEEINRDKQLKEAYSIYNASNLRVAKKFYATILEHIGYAIAIKRTIKPRKKKEIPISKRVERLQYLKNSEEFKLVSLAPEKLIGAKIVWTFNAKTRDLSRMESKDGFDVKGSTLQNGTQVTVRKVRKPDFMRSFSDGTKARLDKEFNSLRTNERPGNYRINKDTILVKVYT